MKQTEPEWLNELRFNDDGLLPVIVQDRRDGIVLMVAYADREAIRRTWIDGQAWFYSRSRRQYWRKGATSGNTQKVFSIAYDCDADAVLYEVEPAGPACHTGERSCFYRRQSVRAMHVLEFDSVQQTSTNGTVKTSGDLGRDPTSLQPDPDSNSEGLEFLQSLYELVRDRAANPPEGSYVAHLLAEGDDRMLQKIGEEAVEVLLAGKKDLLDGEQRQEFLGETADLLFHLTVFLAARQVGWQEVIDVLEGRHRSR